LKPTKKLPDDYLEIFALNLSINRKALILINGFALLLLMIFGLIFADLFTTLRPKEFDQGNLWNSLKSLNTLLAIVLMLILHEGTHAVFFWKFTGDKPKLGVTAFYAYAAAPKWFIPKPQYVIIGLAPLILITVIGIAIVPIISPELLPYHFFLLMMNATGSAGDIYVVAKVSRYPKDILVKDLGDAFQIYVNK